VFCIRKNGDSVGDAESLWLEHEPTIDEIKSAFDNLYSRSEQPDEIVFCGYGEPMERAEIVVETAEYIKSKTTIPLRLNTNGLVKLINPEFEIVKLKVFDTVSVSLNADNAVDYQKLTRSVFGDVSFDSMLSFAKQVKEFTKVLFTVVDIENPSLDIEKCRIISGKYNIELRVRNYSP
jgi:TatD family-associated radical SAM protein